jgi:hypothetical protein
MVAFQNPIETTGYQSVPSAPQFALPTAASTSPNMNDHNNLLQANVLAQP